MLLKKTDFTRLVEKKETGESERIRAIAQLRATGVCAHWVGPTGSEQQCKLGRLKMYTLGCMASFLNSGCLVNVGVI